LDGTFAKLRRGDRHAKTLASEAGAWTQREAHEFSLKSDPPYRVWRVRVHIEPAPDLVRWSVLLGDMLFNYRSALDHLAYAAAIVGSGQNPPPSAGRVQFPICDSWRHWKDFQSRLDDIPRRVRTEMQFVQPYKRRDVDQFRELTALRNLNDWDKHRLLHIAVQIPERAGYQFLNPVPRFWPVLCDGPLQNDADCMAFIFDSPVPYVGMDFKLSFVVALEVPGWGVSPLGPILETIRRETRLAAGRIQPWLY
jgi:hypothetical protein